MKKVIILTLTFFALGKAIGQVTAPWVKPNNSYGTVSNRGGFDSTLLGPTGCGGPQLRAIDLKRFAQYFDSCAHRHWIYDPKTMTWDSSHLGPSGAGVIPTLQQVFNAEAGGSRLTKTDTIQTHGNNLIFDSLYGNTKLTLGASYWGLNTGAAVLEGSHTGSGTGYFVHNLNSYTGSCATFDAVNDVLDQMVMQMPSSLFGVAGASPREALIHANSAGGLNIMTVQYGTSIHLGVGINASPTLAPVDNVVTIQGGTGDFIIQKGTRTPTDYGDDFQVVGKARISDTIKLLGGIKVTGLTSRIDATDSVLIKATDNLVYTIAKSDLSTLSMVPIGSSSNGNGAIISGTTLELEPASINYGGVVNVTSQTFAGQKTFNDGIAVTGNGDNPAIFSANRNSFVRINMTNSSSGSGAGVGILALNNIASKGTFDMGSTGSAFSPDALLVATTGAGGIQFSTNGRAKMVFSASYFAGSPYVTLWPDSMAHNAIPRAANMTGKTVLVYDTAHGGNFYQIAKDSIGSTGGGTVISVTGTTNRITSTGGTAPVIDISASYVGQSSITILGTVATGTWQANIINQAYLGTGGGGSTKFLREDNTWQTVTAGTVTTVSGLSPLFTVSNPTTTPTFALSNAAAYTNWGNRTSSSAAPTYFTNPFIDSVKRISGTDSVFGRINGTWVFQFIDSVGSGGGGSVPANNIVFGTGSGETNDNNFQYIPYGGSGYGSEEQLRITGTHNYSSMKFGNSLGGNHLWFVNSTFANYTFMEGTKGMYYYGNTDASGNSGTQVMAINYTDVTVPVRLIEGQGASVASANNLTLGNDGNTFEITGTTQINLISNVGYTNGAVIRLMFTSTPTVKTAQTTSGSNIKILLAGATDFAATADDVLVLELSTVGGVQAWREISRTVN